MLKLKWNVPKFNLQVSLLAICTTNYILQTMILDLLQLRTQNVAYFFVKMFWSKIAVKLLL